MFINFKKLVASFRFAFSGIKTIFKEEQPFRIMLYIAALVTAAMFYFNLSLTQKAVLFMIITLVLTLEVVNSIVEKFLDFIHPNIDGRIKIIKDMLAGIVLIASIASVIIGVLIFWPLIF
ncbi:MAG: diacylglycerol kinase family protein [Candidatus Nealsonbacteria bacterium]|nr:diacylglycerol kinase family protein [Candidatus Nealsonbacteria bacterium]